MRRALEFLIRSEDGPRIIVHLRGKLIVHRGAAGRTPEQGRLLPVKSSRENFVGQYASYRYIRRPLLFVSPGKLTLWYYRNHRYEPSEDSDLRVQPRCPPTDRQSDPIQPSARDLRDIFLGLCDGMKGTWGSIRVNGGGCGVSRVSGFGGAIER